MDDFKIHIPEWKVRNQLGDKLSRHYVYVMQCGQHFKVGVSYDVDSRRKVIQRSCPSRVTVRLRRTATFLSAYALERMIHDRLAPFRIHGEWFDCGFATVKQVFTETIRDNRERIERAAIAEMRRKMVIWARRKYRLDEKVYEGHTQMVERGEMTQHEAFKSLRLYERENKPF